MLSSSIYFTFAATLDKSCDHGGKADLCLAMGSSLTVTPAADIPEVRKSLQFSGSNFYSVCMYNYHSDGGHWREASGDCQLAKHSIGLCLQAEDLCQV